MTFECLLFDVGDDVATITFNRPDQGNSMDLTVMRDLMHASIRCDEDPANSGGDCHWEWSFFLCRG